LSSGGMSLQNCRRFKDKRGRVCSDGTWRLGT
jgi:hypothetical protein